MKSAGVLGKARVATSSNSSRRHFRLVRSEVDSSHHEGYEEHELRSFNHPKPSCPAYLRGATPENFFSPFN